MFHNDFDINFLNIEFLNIEFLLLRVPLINQGLMYYIFSMFSPNAKLRETCVQYRNKHQCY